MLPPGVDSPEDLRERSLTPLVSDVGPNVEVPGLFKIPFIASALRRNDCNSHALCSSLLYVSMPLLICTTLSVHITIHNLHSCIISVPY